MAEDRLTILERAQLLHDATLRRHGAMLETHAETLTVLRDIQERQERLQQTLDAIKDLLDRGNGH
jgi:hypothetical protein